MQLSLKKLPMVVMVLMFPICSVVVGMGATHEEVAQNIIEGIKFHLDGLKQEGLPIPSANSEAENLVFEYSM